MQQLKTLTKNPKKSKDITKWARSASVQSRLEEERAWFSEQMSDLLNSAILAELSGLCSLEHVVAHLGEDGARALLGMCSEEKRTELQASSAAVESEDEEQLFVIGLGRVYCRLEKVLDVIEEVKRLCELDGQCKGLFLECKEEVLELVALLVEHNRLPAVLAEKVMLLYGEDD